MENNNTHFIFDGKKILISSNLKEIFTFLEEIEKEIESFLNFDKKLKSIKKQHLETIKFVEILAGKLKDNSIDFKFTFSEPPDTIADKLDMYHPVRSKMIIIFANLETLLCLNIAYDNKTSNKKIIIDKAMDPGIIKSFYNNFCLNQKNDWGQKNQERLEHITSDDLRKLRNSLTHFFSVDKGLQVADSYLNDKSRKIEQATNFKIKFISPEDLYEITKGVAKLMIEKWNQDYLAKNSSEFENKILAVKSIIESSGARTIKGEQINI